MKPPNYNWCCHRCTAVNQAITSTCAKCEFPVIASAEEISLGRVATGIEKPKTVAERWSRALIVLGYALILLGALIVRIAIGASAIGALAGAVMALVGVAFVGVLSKMESS